MFRVIIPSIFGVILAGCAYAPGDLGSPLARRVTWFSFLAGDDIRAACQAGAPDRFRLVYNANWLEQVRVYEIGASGPRSMDQRVFGDSNLIDLSVGDPLAPWRGAAIGTTLSPNEYDGLLKRLSESGAYRSPDSTLTLPADQFYWLAASCHDGAFHLTAWLYPSEAFARATFPLWLAALDITKVPTNPPRPWTDPSPEHYGVESGFAAARVHNGRPPGIWAVGISHDRMIDRVEF